jgi:UDP-N-acetylglucosamine:LPS N-acetylglucosamine transferase
MADYKVLILTAPSGHTTLAKAVQGFLEDLPGVNIKTIDLVADGPEWDLFRFFYRYTPFMMKVPFVITLHPDILHIIGKINIRRHKEKLEAMLEQENPDLVITTYHGYIPVIDQIRGRFRFKYINPISDPVSLHPILFSRTADYNIGFDENSQEYGRRLRIPPERVQPSGWFTGRQFFEKPSPASVRQKLGLVDRLTLLVCAGSEGNNAVVALLPALLLARHSRDFQVIFILGHNPALLTALRRYYRLAAWLNPHFPPVRLKGFTDKMADYIAASDVVIGKAGPNLIFETIASQKPFIAISHISGNEDGNLEMIRENDLGWVAENPFYAGRLIKKIIDNPALLDQKKSSLEKMASKCYQGGLFLRERVMEWNPS